MDQYRYWLALKQITGLGDVLYKRLIETYKQPEAIFEASETALLQVEGLSKGVVEQIHTFKDFDTVDRELEEVEKHGATLIPLNDPAYPPLLSEIYDPPPFLYVKGKRKARLSYPLAVVGSRKITAYGRRVTERLCHALVEQGISIVSGFARGVDGLAHHAALSREGETVAVLGCGIDLIYPPEHKKLFQEIMEHGTIYSEFSMGAAPAAHHFPRRNRIISGLSLGCIIVEATRKSGSLITARLALEQGREVFAIPGSIYSEMSEGPHHLIASGAKLVCGVEDILNEILPQMQARSEIKGSEPPALEAEEAVVFKTLSFEPKHIDRLIMESKLPVAAASGLLLSLELKGVVRQMAGQYYVKM